MQIEAQELTAHPILRTVEVHCIQMNALGRAVIEIWNDNVSKHHAKNFQAIMDIHLHLLQRSPMTTTRDGLLFSVPAHEALKPGCSGLVEIDFFQKGNYRGMGVFLKEVYDVYPTESVRPSERYGVQCIDDELFNFGPLDPSTVAASCENPSEIPTRSSAPPPTNEAHIDLCGPAHTYQPDWTYQGGLFPGEYRGFNDDIHLGSSQ